VKTVLHLIETGGPGGAETVYLQLIRSLDPTRWRSIAVLPTRGWLYDQLVASGVEPIVVRERHSLDVAFFTQIAALVRRSGVDIVHSHLFGSSVRAALLSRFCGIPAIGTLHGEMDMPRKERFRSLKIAIVNRGLRRIVFVSEHLRRSYLDTVPLRRDLTMVVRNGIDMGRFSENSDGGFRREFGIAPVDFVVGAIGNPSPVKGFGVLLEAARILKSRAAGYRFVIVGDLNDGRGGDLLALRHSLGLTEDVVLTGLRSDVHCALASFDVYALTSRSEGFSLSLVEAMAAGLPVVATRCGGPEEILENGVTGLLVENGSAEAVASAIEHLRADRGERSRLGAAARASARDRFALRDSVRAYERLYDECLVEHNAPVLSTVAADSAKTRVLITDGEQRAALAIVRSLGRAGYEVHVCSSRSRSIAGTSRHCAGSYRVADPLRQPEQFLSDLTRLARDTNPDLLIPVTEAALLAVLPNRARFNCAIPFATATAFEQISNKRMVLDAAKAHGIAVPKQIEVSRLTDVSQLSADFQFPVVLKPCRSVAGSEAKRIHAGVTYALRQDDLTEALERIPDAAYPILLQERIDGPGFGISVLVWDGELRAAFAHRRIREKPPSGGVSVLRESIPLDRELLSRSLALLREFRWQGVAMVEYKLDSKSGVPYLMEINGRFWGSLQLAIDSGVDFPNLLVRAALGADVEPVTTYESGIRSRWEWGEVDHLLASLFHSSVAMSPSRHGRGSRRLAAISAFLRDFGGSQQAEVFRSDDPGPFLRETVDWFRRR
jgi:glycosyltransferase involved in cell wall biosynthesis/predicted ATP-grasp superfamily ATP-dependent carboligase